LRTENRRKPKKQRTKKKLTREEKEENDKSEKPKPSNPTDASPPEASGKSFHNPTSRRRDLRGILTTHESRNVGNVGPREFGATVPDIGPKRPKSLRCTH
ncbi:hypothetical protein PIB30_062114, partial [Stylosanthes scabra]|nr:hypothetical protein [Stylosanthes scabra]